jgi:streptogrisin D
VKSGTYHYGDSAGASGYPAYDMVRISPEGDSFINKIWTDPPAADTRITTGGGDPQMGAIVCTSGMATFAVCGAEVVAVTATFCPAPDFVCRVGIFKTEKVGDHINQAGDSGGPVYKQLTNDGAGIRGIMIGNDCSGNPCARVYSTKWSFVRDHLNVTVH